jgi:hypothetical protein
MQNWFTRLRLVNVESRNVPEAMAESSEIMLPVLSNT